MTVNLVRGRGTDKTHSPDGSITLSEQTRRHQLFLDAQELTVSCGLCPDFAFTGPAAEARAAASLHRAEQHPGGGQKRRTVNRECKVPGCVKRCKPGVDRCWDHAAQSEKAPVEKGGPEHRMSEPPAAAADGGRQGVPGHPSQPVLGEVVAVGVQADSGAASEADLLRREPERAATSPNTDNERKSMASDRPKTRDEILASFIRFRDEHGRLPLPSDAADADYLPAREFARHTANAGFESWQAIWDHFDAGKLPMGRAAGNYRLTGTLAAAGKTAKPKKLRAVRTAKPADRSATNGSHASKAERLLAAATAVDDAEAALANARVELKQAVEELAA